MIVTEVETLRLEESPNILWVLVHTDEGLTGLGEAKKIATMAEAYHLPVAPHDCTGPVVLAASTHLCVNLPNALTQETVRAYYTGWYKELVTKVPEVSDGHVSPPEGPGLGTELLPNLGERPDAHLVTSTLEV